MRSERKQADFMYLMVPTHIQHTSNDIFLFISSCVSVVVHETMQVSKVEADMKQAMWVLSMSYFDFF